MPDFNPFDLFFYKNFFPFSPLTYVFFTYLVCPKDHRCLDGLFDPRVNPLLSTLDLLGEFLRLDSAREIKPVFSKIPKENSIMFKLGFPMENPV